MMNAKLGAFRLLGPLGKGGMGTVFRGVHDGSGEEAAIKVIAGATDERRRALFRQEVQAQARLLHPGIVEVWDYGLIDADAANAHEDLIDGSPFVVMELARGGTAREHLPLASWNQLRPLLLQTLDALAFSHARGVIHRDLKPENLLIFRNDDADHAVKLADFGLAHSLHAPTEQELSCAGTPHYMAPEQARGMWRDFGPWTDIYAVGCIVWEILCQRPPFTASSPMGVLLKHLNADERPIPAPTFPIPDGLNSWLEIAMAVDPRRRFQCAADAAQALPTALESEDRNRIFVAQDHDELVQATTHLHFTSALNTLVFKTELLPQLSDDDSSAQIAAPAVAPDIPPSWRLPRRDKAPRLLAGCGLGLFGLREIPFVDRDEERENFWRVLRDCCQSGTPRALVVSGESGSGKSRLVEWMATRASELGVATLLRANQTPTGQGPTDGVGGLLRRALSAWQLNRTELLDHIQSRLSQLNTEGDFDLDPRAFTEFLDPAEDRGSDRPLYYFSDPREKLSLVTRFAAALARRRPIIFWLDDAQWSIETFHLTQALLKTGEPILVVLTIGSDLLAELPQITSHLDELRATDLCHGIDLTPLSADYHRKLVDQMLYLEPDLADSVATRTEGNPHFAAQLLGAWIEGGLIDSGPKGYRLEENAAVELPDGIHELWMERICSLTVHAGDPRVWGILESAALLGRQVVHAEWNALCAGDGLDAEQITAALVDRGMARRTDEGWSFAHNLLMESLVHRVRHQGRFQTCHRRCAALLEDVYPDKKMTTAARRAEHYLQAGDFDEGLKALHLEQERLRQQGDHSRRHQVLLQSLRLIDDLELSRTDPRRIHASLAIANIDLWQSESAEEIVERTRALFDDAVAIGDRKAQAFALLVSTQALRAMGDLEEACRAGERAATVLADEADQELLARIESTLGWTLAQLGRFPQAEYHMRRSESIARQMGSTHMELVALQCLGSLADLRGDRDAAETLYRRSLDRGEKAGFLARQAHAHNGLGEVARFRGDAETAGYHYCQMGDLAQRAGQPEVEVMALLNRIAVSLMQRKARHTDELLARFEQNFSLYQNRYQPYITLSKLTVSALDADWRLFDSLFASLQAERIDQTFAQEFPWYLDLISEIAEENGSPRRAQKARTLRACLRTPDRAGTR